MNEEIDIFVREIINTIRRSRNGVITATEVICITDTVFLEIENNQELMGRYLTFPSRGLNATIGRYVREILSLTNMGRETLPESTLIKSYERHGFQSE